MCKILTLGVQISNIRLCRFLTLSVQISNTIIIDNIIDYHKYNIMLKNCVFKQEFCFSWGFIVFLPKVSKIA